MGLAQDPPTISGTDSVWQKRGCYSIQPTEDSTGEKERERLYTFFGVPPSMQIQKINSSTDQTVYNTWYTDNRASLETFAMVCRCDIDEEVVYVRTQNQR